jgi:hypothetical protein
MTPEERERLSRQLTVITAPLPPMSPEALPPKAGEPSENRLSKLKAPWRKASLPHWHRVRLVLFAAIVGLALLGTGLAEGLAPRAFGLGSQLFGLVPAPSPTHPAPGQIPGDVIARSPTVTVSEIERVLERVNSPILPYAGDVYVSGVQYGIDPVFALAFWMKESREASDGSVAASDHNPGYTEGLSGDPRCGRWACWPTWPEGIAGWFHYMRVFFVDRGIVTVESILPIYAPSSENNTSGYIAFVLYWAGIWRAESAANG